MATGYSKGLEIRQVQIPAGAVTLEGELALPQGATSIVLFAHGSGSNRHSHRNQAVAQEIRRFGMGTLLFDLITPEEAAVDSKLHQLRYNIDLLARRLMHGTHWLNNEFGGAELRLGFFGSSTGGGAALVAATQLGSGIGAVVSRGGRPDLAGYRLKLVKPPTLLIVGSYDEAIIRLNEQAYSFLQGVKEIRIVPGASHLFEEPGTLEQVATLSANWFRQHLHPPHSINY